MNGDKKKEIIAEQANPPQLANTLRKVEGSDRLVDSMVVVIVFDLAGGYQPQGIVDSRKLFANSMPIVEPDDHFSGGLDQAESCLW
jgi:hypothetical protein